MQPRGVAAIMPAFGRCFIKQNEESWRRRFENNFFGKNAKTRKITKFRPGLFYLKNVSQSVFAHKPHYLFLHLRIKRNVYISCRLLAQEPPVIDKPFYCLVNEFLALFC